MAASLGSFSVEVLANIARFESDMGKVRKLADSNAKQMQASFTRAGVALGTAIAGGVTALTTLTALSIKSAANFADMAQKVGASVESLSTLAYAADQSGVAVDQLQSGMIKLAKNSSDAAMGVGSAVNAFDALGISVKNADGSLKDTGELLREVSGELSKYQDSAEKTAIAVAIFGKAGAELIPMLNEGAEGLAEMEERAEKFGLKLSTETAQAAEAFGDKLDDLKALTTGLGNDIMTAVLPALNGFAQGFIDAGVEGREFSKVADNVKAAFEFLAVTFIKGVEVTQNIGAAIGALVVTIEDLAGVVGEAGAPIANYFEGIGLAMGGNVVAAAGKFATAVQQATMVGNKFGESIKKNSEQLSISFEDNAAAAQKKLDAMADSAAGLTEEIDKNTEAGKRNAPVMVDLAKAAAEAAKAQEEAAKRLTDYNNQMMKAAEEQSRWVAKQKNAAAEQQRYFDDQEKGLRDEITLLGLSGKAREDMLIQLEAERLARDANGNVVEAQRLKYVDLLTTISDTEKIARAADEIRGMWADVGQSLAEYLMAGAENGFDGVLDQVEGFARRLQSLWAKNAITIPLQQGQGLQGVGQAVNANSMYGQGGTGTTAGGWMSAAGSAYGGWQAAQEGNALGTVAGFTAAGAQIGGVYGAIVGAIVGVLVAVFKKVKPPDVRIGAAGYTRKPEETFTTVFGEMEIGTRGDIDQSQFTDAVTQFDESIASVIRSFQNGAEQFDAVKERLSTWSVDLRGDAISGEAVIESRFNAILETFDATIQSYVRGAEGLEAQVQRLSDAAFIQAAAATGALTSDFAELAEILEANRKEGEQIAALYERIRGAAVVMRSALDYAQVEIDLTGTAFIQFATDVAEAAGGLQRAAQLWDAYFQSFYTEAERASRGVEIQTATAGREFEDVGLNLSDFMGASGAAAFRQQFESLLPTLSPEEIVEWLQAGEALGKLNDLLGQTSTSAEEAAQSYADFVGKFQQGGSEFQRNLAGLRAEMEANIATANELAIAAGMQGASEEDLIAIRQQGADAIADLIRGLTDTVVQQIANLYGTSAQQIESRIAEIDAQIAAIDRSDSGFGMITGMQVERDLQAQRVALDAQLKDQLAAEEALRRQTGALDLAQNLADLSLARGISFEDLASELGLDLTMFGKDLGVNADAVGELVRTLASDSVTQDFFSGQIDRLIEALLNPDDAMPRGGNGKEATDPLAKSQETREQAESELLAEVRALREDNTALLSAIRQSSAVTARNMEGLATTARTEVARGVAGEDRISPVRRTGLSRRYLKGG